MAAESVGLAASVAGLLSLGLQITGGIVKYMDAFEGRDDELRNVKKQNDNLAGTLRAMKTVLAGLQGQSLAVTAAVDQNIRSCEEDLQAIEALCIKLSDRAGSTWTNRLENKKKKVTFAFHRNKLRDLELQLQKAHCTLQLIQGGLGLETSNRNTTLLTAIESSSRDQASEMLLIRSEVAALATPVADINDKLPDLLNSVDQTVQSVMAHSGAMGHEIQDSSQRVRYDLQHYHNLIVEHLKTIDQKVQILGEDNNSLRKLVFRAASKPAALKSLCDDIKFSGKSDNLGIPSDRSKSHQQSTSSDSSRNLRPAMKVGKVCICPRPARSCMQMQMLRGHTYLSGEWESKGHWSSCPLSKTPRKQRLKASLRYTGVSRLLNSVIEISLALTSGAGGCSISPSFTYYPTADVKSDPAFRLINVIKSCHLGHMMQYSSRYPPVLETDRFSMACLNKLAKLLEERQTYPAVVDNQNMSLMHHAASSARHLSAFYYERPSKMEKVAGIFPILLSYGVPAFSYDIRGLSPLHHLTYQRDEWVGDAVEALSRANFESQPVISSRSLTGITDLPIGTDFGILSIDKFPEVATALECGPLSVAIINNDLDEVSRVLSRSPDSIAELDIYGRSPLHLAATKPEILEKLVGVAKLSILNQRDRSGANALEKAMLLSSKHCVNGRGYARCKGCSCYLCAKCLLDAGCNLVRPHGARNLVNYSKSLGSVLENSSELARRHYIFHMRKIRSLWRPEHALTHKALFTKQEVGRKKTTDIRASILQPPRQLQIWDEADEAVGSMSDWIFQQISSVHLANLFYRYGFMPGPSVFLQLRQPDTFRLRNLLNPGIVCWLLEHGGDLFLRSPAGPVNKNADDGVYAAHYVFYLLGMNYWDWLNSCRETVQGPAAFETLRITVTCRNLTDGCHCPCSKKGCSPFTWMMKGVAKAVARLHVAIPEREFLYHAKIMADYYSSCGPELALLTYAETIRFMTFEALGLVHSCCNAFSLVVEGAPWVEIDDAGITEDPGFLLDLHEKLVVEFMQRASGYLGNGPDNLPLFPQFWESYWANRMTQELEALDGDELTESERRDAEEIGVIWDGSTESAKCESGNPYEVYEMEHYWFELDLICPEYNEPWPKKMRRRH